MDLLDIANRVADIAQIVKEHPVSGSGLAHCGEYALWADVLQDIADGNTNAQKLAQHALRTRDVLVARWFD